MGLADVKAFEQTMAARSAPKSASESGAEDDDRAESDSDTAVPKKRKVRIVFLVLKDGVT